MAEANAQVVALLDDVESRFGAAGDRLVLGGFSQGAMLALDVAVRSSRPLAALCLLSGTLLCADVWTPLLDRLRAIPVFQSHGAADPLLPFSAAARLHELLVAARVELEWVPFQGGHEIPNAVLGRLKPFLARALGL